MYSNTLPESQALSNVLVVEDDKTLRSLLVYALSKDFSVVSAKNGVEALTSMSENCPDVILSDVMMPEMDGIELFRATREDRTYSKVPFIFMSASDDARDDAVMRSPEVREYISKPFDVRLLRDQVADAVRSQKDPDK